MGYLISGSVLDEMQLIAFFIQALNSIRLFLKVGN